jgi:hypothetical protein
MSVEMEFFLKWFAVSMTCLAVGLSVLGLIVDWRDSRRPKKEYEEVELPDGRKLKAPILPPLDLDYP